MSYNGTVTLTDACISLKPNAGVSISDEDLTTLIWDEASISEDSLPTNAEITAEKNRLQAIEDAQDYARKRKAKYDALNQFELISNDSINGTTTHKDAILAIKSEFPKP